MIADKTTCKLSIYTPSEKPATITNPTLTTHSQSHHHKHTTPQKKKSKVVKTPVFTTCSCLGRLGGVIRRSAVMPSGHELRSILPPLCHLYDFTPAPASL